MVNETKAVQAKPKVALIGSDTLLGRELADQLKSWSVLEFSPTGDGNFGEEDGEAIYLQPLEPSTIKETEALIMAGSEEGAEKAYQLAKAQDGKPIVLDCNGLLENRPEAAITSGLVPDPSPASSWLQVVAHPVAAAICLTLSRISARFDINQSHFHVFEPASEGGRAGVAELQQQTTNLLTFKPLPTDFFGGQLAFNLMAALPAEAKRPLAPIEQRIEKHLATLASRVPANRRFPMPSLRLVQAPVFHSYAISAFVELDEVVNVSDLSEALASAQIEIRGADDALPSNVNVAGESGLIVGDIRVDRNNQHAAWLWIAFDNLKIVAESTANILRTAAESTGA